jgi:hypothetical protein
MCFIRFRPEGAEERLRHALSLRPAGAGSGGRRNQGFRPPSADSTRGYTPAPRWGGLIHFPEHHGFRPAAPDSTRGYTPAPLRGERFDASTVSYAALHPSRRAGTVRRPVGARIAQLVQREREGFGEDCVPGVALRLPPAVKRQLSVPLSDDYSSPRSAQHNNHSSAPFLFGSFSL